MLRVVFDTVVFVRSLINPHSICGQIVSAYFHRYRLFISEPVAREILEVLHRPEPTRKFRSLGAFDLTRVIDLLGEAEVVIPADLPPISRDPEDDKFLATALAANADYLVSEDKDLLVLTACGPVKIISAEAFASLLEQSR